MITFPNRHEPGYIGFVKDLLAPECALASALALSKPEERSGRTFTNVISINAIGISASLLFRHTDVLPELTLLPALSELLSRGADYLSRGKFIRLRILCTYPYSFFALARIEAESTPYRSSINEPRSQVIQQSKYTVDSDAHISSELVRAQREMLNRVQELYDYFQRLPGWGDFNLNSISVRFTPVGSAINCLMINNYAFCDSYIFAKLRRQDNVCKPLLPVLGFDSTICEDDIPYRAIEDHFRYLWELDTTVSMLDATEYEPNKPRSLGRIKPPLALTFDHRVESLGDSVPSLTDSDREVMVYKARTSFLRYCAPLAPGPTSISLFIACSWRKCADGLWEPNEIASTLRNYLEQDFCPPGGGSLSVSVVKAKSGETVGEAVEEKLRHATLAIVVLTNDIRAGRQYYARPNIYHELGFLTSHLGHSRVYILKEAGVELPSNIEHKRRDSFDGDSVLAHYVNIIEWLFELKVIRPGSLLLAINNHNVRVFEAMKSKKIDADAGEVISKRLEELRGHTGSNLQVKGAEAI